MAATLRFPRAARLSGKRQFDAVAAQGRRIADGVLSLRVRRNGLPLTRLGLAVRRGKGGAIARNRWKRLIREAFRLGRPGWPAGFDVVVSPQRPDARPVLAPIGTSLAALLARADADPRLRDER